MATVQRKLRRRPGRLQQLPAAELERDLAVIADAITGALAGGGSSALTDALRAFAARRLRQGLHPAEIYSAWQEVRAAVEAAIDGCEVLHLLNQAEDVLTSELRQLAPARGPYALPASELESVRLALERLTVRMELIEQASGAQPVQPAAPLTVKERDVLSYLAAGLTMERAAKAMEVSPATARTYLRRATDKLGAFNRVNAVAIAITNGMIVPRGA
jgi:DNA-binding CsgD family transcriptional regulator